MVERERSTQNSNASWPTSNDVAMFRLGYLQATCDQTKATCNQILAKVVAMQAQPTAPPPGPAKTRWAKWRAWADDFLRLHKLFVAIRIVLLPSAAVTLWSWLGWLLKLLVGR
jgi:hypothetical protein